MVYLNVMDGNTFEKKEITTKEIFDPQKYHTLKAVTYVSSATFFYKNANKFEKTILVLGIEDGNLLNNFSDGLDKILNAKEQMKFWNGLNEATKEKIRSNKYQIRYPNETPFHSKIYLLEGFNAKCVVIGSANFSNKAFEGKQFEELIIYENNDKVFEFYLERFEEIYMNSGDFIAQEIIQKENEQLVMIEDPEMITKIIQDGVEFNKEKVVIKEEVLEKIRETPKMLEKELEKAKEFVNVFELVTKSDNKNKLKKLLSRKEMEKKLPLMKTLLSKQRADSFDHDNRVPMFYNVTQDRLYIKKEDEKNTSSAEKNISILYEGTLSKEEIEKEILLIHDFIESYGKFSTDGRKIEKLKKIYEILLYSYLSPFIWKIRDHYTKETGRSGAKTDFKPFLIVGGRAGSGKTNALEFAARMIGNNNEITIFTAQEKYLPDYFNSEIVSPILLDEVAGRFFSGNKGEQLIKEVASYRSGIHPVMIGTTNATEFTPKHQNTRRIYYVQVDNTFDVKKKEEAARYNHDVFCRASDRLFKDVVRRFTDKIKNGEEFYHLEDMLKGMRSIFKEYYQMLEMEIPDFFPKEMFKDFEERGQLVWYELYKNYNHAFIINDDNTIFVKTEEFTKKGTKDEQKYISLLSTHCIQEDTNVLILKKQEFFDFIEEEIKTIGKNDVSKEELKEPVNDISKTKSNIDEDYLNKFKEEILKELKNENKKEEPVEEKTEKKPGFFARLFGKKTSK